MSTVIADYLGNEYEVAEVRDTRHSFPVHLGYSAEQLKCGGPRRGRQVILTPELVAHLEKHRRSKFAMIDLPISKTVLVRLRSELGMDRYDDGHAWWAARLADLSTLTLDAFAAKHGVTTGMTEIFRRRLVGRTNRVAGWWLEDPAKSALLSERPASEIAIELGVAEGTVGRLRSMLKVRGFEIAVDHRERRSRAMTGRSASEATREAARQTGKRPKSEEHKRKIAEANRRHWERKREATMGLTWESARRNEGQHVDHLRPQVACAAKGDEGPGEGLRLIVDNSDQTWEVMDTQLGTLAAGKDKRTAPTVEEAIRLRQAVGCEAKIPSAEHLESKPTSEADSERQAIRAAVEAERKTVGKRDLWWPIPPWEVPEEIRWSSPLSEQGQFVEAFYGGYEPAPHLYRPDESMPYKQILDKTTPEGWTYRYYKRRRGKLA